MTTTAPPAHDHTTGPALPRSRGELSRTVRQALTRPAGTPLPERVTAAYAEPYGDDLQLALYLCYELHYRGFSRRRPRVGVGPRPAAAASRDGAALPVRAPCRRRPAEKGRGRARGPSRGTRRARRCLPIPQGTGELWQFREYAAQRSLYHLKEADPHAWVIPRLTGRAKAAMVAVEYDEFGAGRAERIHARLFADLMTDLGLDTTYGHYVDAASTRRC